MGIGLPCGTLPYIVDQDTHSTSPEFWLTMVTVQNHALSVKISCIATGQHLADHILQVHADALRLPPVLTVDNLLT